MAVDIKVNGAVHSVPAEPDTPLLYVLRNDLGLNAAKFGIEAKIIAQHVEQRRIRLGRHAVHRAVHLDIDSHDAKLRLSKRPASEVRDTSRHPLTRTSDSGR